MSSPEIKQKLNSVKNSIQRWTRWGFRKFQIGILQLWDALKGKVRHAKFSWDKFINLVLATGTVLLAIYTYRLYAETRKAVDDAHTALVDVQRAFVTVDDLKITSLPKDAIVPELWEITPILENGGNTNTKDMTFFPGIGWFEINSSPIIASIVDSGDPDKVDIAFEEGKKFPASLGPKSSIPMNTYIITKEDAQNIRDGKLLVYILGQAKYRDVFDGTPEHITKFCFRLFGGIGGGNGATAIYGVTRVGLTERFGVSYRMCFHNNCTDKECTKKQE